MPTHCKPGCSASAPGNSPSQLRQRLSGRELLKGKSVHLETRDSILGEKPHPLLPSGGTVTHF